MLKNLTIVIPTYKRNNYLVKLLNTIPKKFCGEVIISDNESHVTEDIIKNFPNFNFIKTKVKLKMFQNWNYGLKNVTTDFFILPSDDDLFCNDSFEVIDNILKKNIDYDIFVFGHNIINEKDTILSSWKPNKLDLFSEIEGFKVFSKGVNARCPSIIMRTKLAKKMGFFDEELEFTAADSLLIQKCLLYGKSVFVPEIISSYRVWPNNATSRLISTKPWMDKIELWTNKLSSILKKDFTENFSDNKIRNIKDDICIQNLIVGTSKLRKKEGFVSAIKFILSNRYPFKSDFKSQLILMKVLILK